jgi:pilus assembly protein Flp/PilA
MMKVMPGFAGSYLRGIAVAPSIIRKLQTFLVDESAATAIEYALIAKGISIVIIAGVNGISTQLSAKYTAILTAFK